MRKRGKLDLASNFTENVLSLNTMEVLQIRCSDIQTNSENFFEVSGIEELADSIDLIGLQQPLVVTKSDNGYLLIAGHRRFEAVKKLDWEIVPCIVSKPVENELEMLALIQTNTQTRDLSYVERMEAAKRTEEILLSLKEKGYKFSGRLRDKIAEVLNESSAAIARMQVIDKNLTDEGKEMLTGGDLSPSVAYEMSKMTKQKQKAFTEKCKKEEKAPTAKELKQFQAEENKIEHETKIEKFEQLNQNWDWKPVNEKPQKSSYNLILASKNEGKWQYKCIDDNFDDY